MHLNMYMIIDYSKRNILGSQYSYTHTLGIIW